MNIENFIKKEALRLKCTRRQVEIAPDIDEKVILKIKKKYQNELQDNFEKYILVMSYTKTGYFFMTGDAIYFDNFLQNGLSKIYFKNIRGVEIVEGKIFSSDKVYINTESEKYILDGSIDGLNLMVLKDVFMHIVSYCKNNIVDFNVSEQGILTSNLPEKLKLAYLEILCNYAYLNDSVIDVNEYNAIIKISIRMEIADEIRKKLRIYMNDFEGRFKTGSLIAYVLKNTVNETGYWDTIRYCLIQDILYIHRIQNLNEPWRNDGFIGSLMERCELRPQQIDTMETAVKLNNKMQYHDVDMKKLKKDWNTFVKSVQGTSAYVPTLYLFCSGSVYGSKTYNGFFKTLGVNQNELNKQRELILQEIIINNQKAVNALIGDMNYLAERLELALKTEDKIQADYDNIKKLLDRVKEAMNSARQEENNE